MRGVGFQGFVWVVQGFGFWSFSLFGGLSVLEVQGFQVRSSSV